MITRYFVSLALVVLAPSPTQAQTVRHYYIAAEPVTWDYTPSGSDLIHANEVPFPWRMRTQFSKERFIEYTDERSPPGSRKPPGSAFSDRSSGPKWAMRSSSTF